MAEMTVSAKVGRYLAGLAHRLEDNPDFMAYVLTAYQAQERLDDSALAEHLGTTLDMLSRLALCRRPEAEAAGFADQVRQIAAYIDADPVALASVVRQVDSLQALAKRPATLDSEAPSVLQLRSRAGLLAAARDRSETEDEQPSPSEEGSSSEE
jgi:hypothetical protein